MKKKKNNKLSFLDSLENDPLKYYKFSNKINALSKGFKKIKISFLSNFTIELIEPFMKVELVKRNLNPEIYFAPYDQIEQEVYNVNSKIYQKSNDVIVLAIRLENLLSELFTDLIYNDRKFKKKISEIKKRIFNLIKQIRNKNTLSKIIFFNFNYIEKDLQSFTSTATNTNLDSLVEEINSYLISLTRKFNSFYIFDFKKVSQNFGLNNFFDKKLFLLSRMPFSLESQLELSKSLSRYINAILVVPKKCLVIDADNTIWGGIIGEDGLDGIKLDEDFPGNIYKSFHRFLLTLRRKGVLLALASKNNKKDVLEVFKKHDDCLLNEKHFSALEINWNDKATNIKKIATDLNIGMDSIVFFDDNPAERELIKSKLPEVNVIDVSNNPLNFEEQLQDSEYFDHVFITEDDLKRPSMYAAEKKREVFLKKSLNIDDYLKSLKTKVVIGFINKESIKRCTQLINKTNQFNLTVKRKSEGDIHSILKNEGVCIWIRVLDKFGDNGLVGVAIATQKKNINSWYIDTFLLSCRVIGRNIEDFFLFELIKKLKEKNKKFELVIGEYIKGNKNLMVENFYRDQKFKKVDGKWVKKLNTFKMGKYKEFIKLVKNIK